MKALFKRLILALLITVFTLCTAALPMLVADAAAPVIQLIGSNPDSVQLGAPGYTDPGAVATDSALTAAIKVSGTVDTSKAGSYILTYSLTSGGTTMTATRTVNVVAMLDPTTIPQFVSELLVPPVMPKSPGSTADMDYYEIAAKQFNQQILPAGMPKTTVFGYVSATDPNPVMNAPSPTIEATVGKPVRVKWINGLVDANGNYLPPLIPIDQTLDWANPSAGMMGRDMPGDTAMPYVGPNPIVTHLHGAHTYTESDGLPLSWYLPMANNIPAGYAMEGSTFDQYKKTAVSGPDWGSGAAVYDYPNDQAAATLWYHDHVMGMTRANVYSGLAGYYILRGGPTDMVYKDAARTMPAVLPGSGADVGQYEIPLAIQDRSFNTDGSLFYPDSRAYFDGFEGPYAPDPASDIHPIVNPEFFGNTIMANGKTWPYQNVEQRQYRYRLLNGCGSRTLILKLSDGSSMWQIGGDGGYLAQPVELKELTLAPAERADIIIDFSKVPAGTKIVLENIGPDAPFGGGTSGVDFDAADPATTGRVMQFAVTAAAGADMSTPVEQLVLPKLPVLGTSDNVIQVSVNEEDSELLAGVGPKEALLGTVIKNEEGKVIGGAPSSFNDPMTEILKLGDTDTWEIYNFTEDAHPIHLHLVTFKVLNRQDWDMATGELGSVYQPEANESGYKDTVIVYPGQVTRIKAQFDRVGTYVWHCHILEHEDNEMMRPYEVVATNHNLKLTLNDPIYMIDNTLKRTDAAPKIMNNRTIMPIRFIAESLGATVSWDPSMPDKVVIKNATKTIQLTLGSMSYLVNGVKMTMDVAPYAENNVTMVPLRFISQALGATVGWNASDPMTVTVKN